MGILSDEKIILKCKKKVAYDSPDHIQPEGTRKDSSTNPLFNEKIYRLFGREKQLKILDLGCAGGGFIRECIDDGHFAIGLEGSDYSKKTRRAEWRTIPECLFTCDITEDFDILAKKKTGKEKVLFNIITSWEVMEHIKEKDLIKVAENVKKHLSKNGMWIMSIATEEDVVNGVRLHQTVKPRAWWMHKFNEMGFVIKEDYRKYFNNQFIRGPYQEIGRNFSFKGSGFNLIVTLPDNNLPQIPRDRLRRKLWEKWMGSRGYRILKIIIS